jgi:protein TonB
VPFVALSEDAVLLEAMAAATPDQGSVIASPSADRFIDQLVATGSDLALIDAAAAPAELAEFLTTLHRQFPQLQLLLAGPGNVQHQITEQLGDGTVFRFVHKPASAQRLKLFVDAALRERETRHRDRKTRITEQILSTPFTAEAASGPASTGGRPWWLMAAVGTLVLIVAAGAVIWYSPRSEHTPPGARAPTASEPAAPMPAQTRTSAPPVAQRTPGPALTQAEQDAVDRAAAQRSERSERERLTEENEARQAALAQQAQRSANDARAAQIQQLVQQARDRISRGALVEPAEDCARTYVSAATELAPDVPEVRAVSLALGEALVGSFRKALSAGDPAAAQRWLEASRLYQVSPAAIDEMAVQLESFKSAKVAQTVATEALTNAPSGDEPASAPVAANVQPSAPASAAASTALTPPQAQIMQESSLHRIAFNAPKYPTQALERQQTGTVDLDFTLTPEGTVTDIKVTASSPRGVFEHTSIEALSHNRYEPVLRNGLPVSQRAHIRMRFAL